jgi:TATA-box binding protein (TBP) (component of TFIID and TFIIIB)
MKVTLAGSLVAVVFYSGKIIITGAKTLEEINYGECAILQMINQAR